MMAPASPLDELIAELERLLAVVGGETWKIVRCDDSLLMVCTEGDTVFFGDPNHQDPDDSKLFAAIVAVKNALPALLAAVKQSPNAAGAILTADQVMTEVEEVASEPVKKALRQAYEGKGRPADKGEIADVALRDLGLERVTMYRRKVAHDEAPIRLKQRARLDRGTPA